MLRAIVVGSCAALLLAVSACGSPEIAGPELNDANSNAAVASVTVTLTASNILVGQTTQAVAVARDAEGNTLNDRSIVWSAAAPSVATVSEGGVVNALNAGSTEVLATVDGVMGHRTVTVAPPSSSGGLAELPRAYVNTGMPVQTGRTIAVPAGGDLQAALNEAQPGDIITLAAGATWTGNFVLPAKSGTDWIVIRSNGAIPTEGVRLKPAQFSLPRITTPNGQPAIATANGAKRYRLIGLEITTSYAYPGEQYGLVALGTDSQNSTQVPSHLIVDRSWIHGTLTSRTRRGVALNCANCAVIDSHIDDIHDSPDDSQAIACWNGPGPFKIVNNYLAGAGENVLFGGSDPSIPGLMHADIEIRRNHFHKPDSWANDRWSVKNLIELKHAYRTLIEGNVFEGNWWDAQDGEWAVFVSINQYGTAPQSGVQDLTLRYNIIRNVGSGILMGTYSGVVTPFARYVEHDNLYYGTNQGIYLASWGGGVRWHIISGSASSVHIERNTYVNDSPNGANSVLILSVDTAMPGLVFRDNLGSAGVYGIGGGGGTGVGAPALAYYASGGVFAGNVLYMAERADEMPTTGGNIYLSTLGALGLDSQYRSAAYPGKGADISAVLAATAGVVQ